MGKILYHNVTQGKYNETESIDLVDEMNENDLILWSESGNACIHKLTQEELENLQKEVNDYYNDLEDE